MTKRSTFKILAEAGIGIVFLTLMGLIGLSVGVAIALRMLP